MADELDEDIFDDLYDDEPQAAPPAPAAKPDPEPVVKTEEAAPPPEEPSYPAAVKDEPVEDDDAGMGGANWNGQDNNNYQPHGNARGGDDGYGPINVKEDGYV